MTAPQVFTVATRRSRLALAQTQAVVDALAAACPDVRIDLLALSTRGDRELGKPLADVGGKGLFIAELEAALLDGRADFAVHSAKDCPAELPKGLCLLAFPPREDPRDCLLLRPGLPSADPPADGAAALAALPKGATVGTSSPRRAAQLLRLRPDIKPVALRGNVETRIATLKDRRMDAICLAVAGLKRLGMADLPAVILSPADCLPAAGQGALAIEAADADRLAPLLATVNHPATEAAVRAERAVVRHLAADCHSPLAVLAEVADGRLCLRARALSPDGARSLDAAAEAPLAEWPAAAARVADDLAARGAADLLAGKA
jgi:hydroxymethylbilane synthase